MPVLRWVVLPLVLALGASLLIRVSGFDLLVERAIYAAGGESWRFGKISLWDFLYRHGTKPVTVVSLGALIGYIASGRFRRLRRWRAVFLFLFLLGLLAPGVITNGVLKEHWPRPRPREVLELGGHREFLSVLSYDPEAEGKSFPCGHCTAGFYFVGLFFLLRRHSRRYARWALIGALLFGTFMGIARMVQGGHFPSDVIWGGMVCWLTAVGLDRVFRFEKGALREPVRKRVPLPAKLAVAGLGLAFLGGALVATPYEDERDWFPVEESTATDPLRARLAFATGEVAIADGERVRISGKAWGHGVPTSRVTETFQEVKHDWGTLIAYRERLSGWFAEVRVDIRVELPRERLQRLHLELGEAEATLDFRRESGERGNPLRVTVANGEGTLAIQAGDAPVRVAEGEVRDERDSVRKGEADLILHVREGFGGEVVVR